MAKGKTITIDLDAEIFDVEGATVERLRRISVGAIDELKALRGQDVRLMYERLAIFYPRWVGVIDCETGEQLPDPSDDPMVFSRLDLSEQFSWFVGDGLRVRPTQR